MNKAAFNMAADAVNNAQSSAEPTRPLLRALPPADPFPIDALGDILGEAAKGIQQIVQAPLAVGCQSVLSAAALATQGHANIVLPTGQTKPLSCYFFTVASTGDRKTASDEEAIRPLRQHEDFLCQQYNGDVPSHQNRLQVWEKMRAKVLNDTKANRVSMETDLQALGPAPSAPLTPMLTCPEPSYEGLCKLFAGGLPSLGLFSNEGGQFIGGYSMSEEKKLAMASGLSGLWDGEPIRRVRAGDGAIIMPGRRLAMHLMVQPEVASILLSDRILADQGMLSRILVSAPETLAGTRLWREPSPEARTAIGRHGERLLEILRTPLPLAENTQNELRPRQLPFSAAARIMWIGFVDWIERQIGDGGALEPIRGLANKLPEHAARLAGVLTLVDKLDAAEVDQEHMAAGITLAQHYATEALRLFSAYRVDAQLLVAQRVLTWLLTAWSEPLVSLVDIYQRGPNQVRDQKTASKIVDTLADHGWLVPLSGAHTVAGHKRRHVWQIVKGAAA